MEGTFRDSVGRINGFSTMRGLCLQKLSGLQIDNVLGCIANKWTVRLTRERVLNSVKG